ncbi:MAG: dTMP kinase [Pseudomonadota bacterium]|nr:dTMP kinase [Pseudomonadota bacterium]
MFITLEGGEGAGKSTQAALLSDRLAAAGRPVLRTREPGGAPGAEILRNLLLGGSVEWSPSAETHLHFAARAEHLARTILPALATGTVVVCDRFADSTMAYQGYGLGADRALIAGLTNLLPIQPDLTLLLHVGADTGTARMTSRPGSLDRYERLDAAFHARVAAGFEALTVANPGRIVRIDGEGEVAVVSERIWAVVSPRLA